ncbi:RHS repeat-associated core domain-containing protein [Oleiharenicola sp. Vm1]|uniref:RHS repeat-associated core domain-containing protein n=1 Tax=Oleiharenicola sp. Vm1 TaxID=3398393 RepID=UPI0039F4F83D
MKSLRLTLGLIFFVATLLSARAVDAYFTSVPSSANAGESYYVAAEAYGDNGADITIYKNGNYFNSAGGYPGASTGGWTADSGPQTVTFMADGWDWEWGNDDYDWAYVTINAGQSNQNPIATVTVDGYLNGGTALRPYGGGINVTVRYHATDGDGNLSGIRPQVWSPDGNLNNNGGSFVSQSGSSGEVVWTVNLNQSGNWYFWADATDTTISPDYVDSGSWGNGFRINVIQDAAPAQAPSVSLNQPASDITISVGTNVTLQSYAEDFSRPLTTHNIDIQKPDGTWNWYGGFAYGEPYMGGPVGPDAPTTSTRSPGFTFNEVGTWYVRSYAANSAGLSTQSVTRTITVLALPQSSVSISPSSQTINAGQSITFNASGGNGNGAYTWGGDASGTGASTSVTFNTAGTRTVTVYRAGDSTYLPSNTGTATITVNASQSTVSISPSSASVTVGQSVAFSASGGAGTGAFVWGGDATGTGASQTVTFNNVGSRTVTVYRQASPGYAQSATATASISVAAAPPAGISQHPQSQTATTGSTVTFSVTASGGGTLSYQWLKNGTPIPGATNATLILSNVQMSDSAGYSVTVTNNGTPVTSNVAWLPIATLEGGGNASSPSAANRSPVAPGIVSTIVGGSGYDIATGSVHRVIRDFQVTGSVGAYPLEMTRTYTTTSGWNYSFVWTAEELVDNYFIQNQSLAGSSQQFINVRTPEGQFLHFDANEAGWPTEFCQTFDGTRVAIVRDPATKRVNAIALHFPDGGTLMMEKCVDSGQVRKFRASYLVDPFGLVTTFNYNGNTTTLLPYQVTDASGRYLRFTGASEASITRVESSDNKWIQWSGATALSYWDGTSAAYSAGNIDTDTMWVRFSDVRQTSPMRNVEYVLKRYGFGATGNLLLHPEEPIVWEVIRERTFVAGDAADAGVLVSTRTVNARQQTIDGVGTVATGPAIDVTEIRGDGATRNFTFGSGGGKMSSATDYRGNRTYFTTWYSNVPTEIKDARNNITNIEATGWGQISKITYPLTEAGQSTRDYRQYSWTGRFLTGERDERGNWTYYDRDSQNRIWRIRYADNSSEEFVFNSLNQVKEHKLRRNAGVTRSEYWVYDATTKLPTTYWPASDSGPAVDGNGPATQSKPHFSYSYYSTGPQTGLLYTSTDPRNYPTTYAYFSSGRLQTETFVDTSTRSYTYDNWGNRLTVTNERGKTTTNTYDNYNRLLTVTDPLNKPPTTYDYTPSRDATKSPYSHVSSAIRRTTFPTARKNAFKYDDDYHVTEEVRAEGTADEAKVSMTYDAVGNLETRTEQVEVVSGSMTTRATTYVYDARNRKREEQAPLSRTTKWLLDAASNVTKITYPDNTFVTKTYNAMNQLESATDERSHTTGYAYHLSGLLNTITDQRSNAYTHTYDAVGRIASRVYPGSPTTQEQWDYDDAGNVWHYTNRSGNVQTFAHNNRNRETSRTWNDGVTPAVSTDYYADGLVWHRSNSAAALTNTYDDDGRLQTQSQNVTGRGTVILTLGYDDDGRRNSFIAGTGQQLGYQYNGRGELQNVRLGDATTGTLFANYDYNLAGQRRHRTAGTVTTEYKYDGAGRLNYLHAANVLRQDFGHDARDRRKWTVRDQNLGDTYTWFDDSQLNVYRHSVSRPDLNFNNPAAFTDTFDYDAAGNRTSWNENGTTTTYAAANALNQYTTITGPSGGAIAHNDGRGNVTTWGGQSFTYDADNRLITASATGLTLSFAYDPDGRLVKVTKNGTSEYRYYDGAQCFLRFDSVGNITDWTVWGPTPDEVIARQTGGAWQYYHQDQINSVYAVTSAAGLVLERYLYDPFGAPAIYDANWYGRAATVIGNPWLFTGQEWRDDLQLSNYKARWYQPTLGRFLQTDPVRFDAGDVNLYRYCGNDPLNKNDPEGKFIAQAIGATIGAAINAYQNYDAFKSGKMGKLEYAASIATGAAYGALATVAPTVAGAALLGGAAAAANSVTNDALSGKEKIDTKAALVSGALGTASGGTAAILGKAAGFLNTAKDPIGKAVGEGRAILNLREKVGIVADAAGNVATTAMQNQKEEKIPVVKTNTDTPQTPGSGAVEFKLDFTPRK